MLLNLLISTIAVYVTAYILPGVHVVDFWTVFVVAIFLGVANAVIKPIIVFLTLPITLVTFGLFIFVINALMVYLAAAFVPGFSVDSFWWALLFSLILSVVSTFLKSLQK